MSYLLEVALFQLEEIWVMLLCLISLDVMACTDLDSMDHTLVLMILGVHDMHDLYGPTLGAVLGYFLYFWM